MSRYHKRKKIIFLTNITILILLSIFINNCGTTHYFVPYKALENKEWQISVGWHFDLNLFYRPQPFIYPEINAYYGIGKEYTFGFGGYLPCFISHVSLTKQFTENNGKYWSYYAHINRVFVFNFNPFIELGTLYGIENNGIDQTFSFGLAYGTGTARERFLPYDIRNKSIIPAIKYSIGGNDIGFSLIHYHGQTKSAVKEFFKNELVPIDTLFVFKPDEVEYIYDSYDFEIKLINGNSIIFGFIQTLYADAFYVPEEEMKKWIGKEYKVYLYQNKYIVLDVNMIKQDLYNNNNVVITNIPQGLVNHIEELNSFIVDNSLGIAIFSHTKQ